MPSKYLFQFVIKIAGQNISSALYAALEEVLVDTSLNMPGMFTFRVHDSDLSYVDNSDLFDIGKEVEISVINAGESDSSGTVLIKGEITALEPHFSSQGDTAMIVRGYDKSHRLHRGRKTRTFMNVTDSGLVSTIANESGLTAKADTTSVTYPYLMQYNQTNMEFLMARAERIGYQVYAENGNLHFEKSNSLPSVSATLTFLEDLLSFDPRWTTSQQADSMVVKGWDAKAKKVITAQATPLASWNQGGMTKTGGANAQSAFSAAQETCVNLPVADTSEAQGIADGLSRDISRDFVQAEGRCIGNALVQAGACIKISKVGTRFSGNYLVTQATHVYTPEGYFTNFSITGRHAPTLKNLLGGENLDAQETGRISGLVTALVTNINDPDNLGRVKVKFAWLGDIESDWIRMASPMAGPQHGLMILPEVNDEVVLGFEHGDIHHPYVLGVMWNNTDKPPLASSEAVASGKVAKRIFKTPAGHVVIFDDTDTGAQISVKSKSGHQIILNDAGGSEKITIKDKTGSNSMEINSTTNSMEIKVNGDFIVDAKGKVEIKSLQAMNLTGTAGMKIESPASTSVKGTQLTLEGTGMAELKGGAVSVNGTGMTEVKAGGIMTIKGALVTIN
jgi:uncharacterized protein involved in type VI secretion and phage assembly